MATYVMSDIHGNLDVFKRMLVEINFKYDGSDTLYLLGDYVDWGPKSLETLLFVKELSEKYDFVIPLIGNHDLMFLEQIQNPYHQDTSWLYANGGFDTYESFKNLKRLKQLEIEEFLDSLSYVIDINVGDKKYLAAHACPVKEFVWDENKTYGENMLKKMRDRDDAVWTRVTRDYSNVIRCFDPEGIYENFICGHTITKYMKDNHFSIIIKENDYINIDCGGKLLEHTDCPDQPYARLACLRLDDFKEYYLR